MTPTPSKKNHGVNKKAMSPLTAIVERQEISKKYAELTMAKLRFAGLAESRRGVHGGYVLARPAGEVTLGDIVRAVDDSYVPSKDPRDEAIEEAVGQGWAEMWSALDAVSLEDAAKS